MQTAKLFRRSNILSRCNFAAQRFQSNNTPSSGQPITNILQEPLHAVSLNPFRYYANLWRMARFRAKYDMNFRLDEFIIGSRQAFVVVSKKLFLGDFEGLQGLMSEEAINRLRPAIQDLSAHQREILNVQENDVYGQFLYSVSFDKSTSGFDFFEIMIAFHCFLGMEEYKQSSPEATSISDLLKRSDRFVLANVRFAKRLTPAVDTDWTVIYANYARTEASSMGRFPLSK